MPKWIVVSIGVLVSLSIGCTYRLGDLTIASSDNYRRDGTHRLVKENIEGSDYKWILVVVPIGIPNLESAIDNAVLKAGGDYMQNMTVYSKMWYIPWVAGKSGYYVTGDVWRIEENHGQSKQ